MNLNSNNVCLNCENLAVNSTCSKHNVEVSLDNYCDSHSFKKALNRGSNCGNCSSYSTDRCPNPSIASAGLLCFSWTND